MARDSGNGAKGRTARLAIQHLEDLRRAGVTQLPRRSGRAAALVSHPPTMPDAGSAPPAGPSTAVSPPVSQRPLTPEEVLPKATSQPSACGRKLLSLDERTSALDTLRAEVAACELCPALVKNRSQTVFGVGSPQPRLCFFGEAPGADEDRQGEPFVGRAGQLLTKMIEACTMKREDVYILNVLKCRPPDNRNPEPDEMERCQPFWERQLEILQPEFICCLGGVASKALLNTNASVGSLRGKLHDFRGAKVVVTYHPAYLLRSPNQKRAAWEDLKLLMREMGLNIPEQYS
jgi:uracil-DNA glycosylase